MRKALLLVLAFSSVAAWADPVCQHVGGGIVTNFLNPTTTFGSATGDLGGGIGVTVLSLTPGPGGVLTLHNQHHWVTTQGDTILAPKRYDPTAKEFVAGVGVYDRVMANPPFSEKVWGYEVWANGDPFGPLNEQQRNFDWQADRLHIASVVGRERCRQV